MFYHCGTLPKPQQPLDSFFHWAICLELVTWTRAGNYHFGTGSSSASWQSVTFDIFSNFQQWCRINFVKYSFETTKIVFTTMSISQEEITWINSENDKSAAAFITKFELNEKKYGTLSLPPSYREHQQHIQNWQKECTRDSNPHPSTRDPIRDQIRSVNLGSDSDWP
jgi:hypothetical protein